MEKVEETNDKKGSIAGFLFVMPFFLIFIAYGIFGRHFESKLTLKELKEVTGVIERAESFESSSRSSGTSKRQTWVEFSIKGSDATYKINTNGISVADDIVQNHLQPGSPVKFYHRHRYQQLIGMGGLRTIYHIESDSGVAVSLNETLEKGKFIKTMIAVGGGFFFLLWLGFLCYYLVKYKFTANSDKV